MVTNNQAPRHPLLQGTTLSRIYFGKAAPAEDRQQTFMLMEPCSCLAATWIISYLPIKCRVCFVPACLQAVSPAMTWWRGGLHPPAIAGNGANAT